MKPQDHFIGPCMAWVARRTLKGRRVCPVQLQGPQVSIDLVNVNQLTFEHKKKKKKKSFLPSSKDQIREFFQISCSNSTLSSKTSLNTWKAQFPHTILGQQNAESPSLSDTSHYT